MYKKSLLVQFQSSYGKDNATDIINPESPIDLERRLIAELAKQQHQSHEDQNWLKQEEINLVKFNISNYQ